MFGSILVVFGSVKEEKEAIRLLKLGDKSEYDTKLLMGYLELTLFVDGRSVLKS